MPAHSLQTCVYRVTYFLGSAARLTVDLVRAPFRLVAHGIAQRRLGRAALGLASPTHEKLTTSLARMRGRLESIERSVRATDRRIPYEGRTFEPTAGIGAEIPATILEALVSPDPGIRRYALGNIGGYADEDVTLLILDALHDPEPSVRIAAVSAASKAKISSAVFSLILLLDDREPAVAQEAKESIEAITGQRIRIDLNKTGKARKKKIEDLKSWWKEERFSHLSEEIKTAAKP